MSVVKVELPRLRSKKTKIMILVRVTLQYVPMQHSMAPCVIQGFR